MPQARRTFLYVYRLHYSIILPFPEPPVLFGPVPVFNFYMTTATIPSRPIFGSYPRANARKLKSLNRFPHVADILATATLCLPGSNMRGITAMLGVHAGCHGQEESFCFTPIAGVHIFSCVCTRTAFSCSCGSLCLLYGVFQCGQGLCDSCAGTHEAPRAFVSTPEVATQFLLLLNQNALVFVT